MASLNMIDVRSFSGTHRFIDAGLVTYEPAPGADLFAYPTYAEQAATFVQRQLL